ncbi:BSD domain-containing protein 1-like isoform X2 [Antedon mediterranea]
MMKKDLVEFGVTVKRDTQATVASGAANIKDQIKTDDASSSGSRVTEGFSRLLSGISETLSPRDYGLEEDDKQSVLITKDGAHIFDRKKAKLHAIQTEPGTYCNEPDGPLDHYEKWCQAFSLEDNKGEISELLVVNTNVRSLYTKMVPAVVSHDDFWNRYFYKIYQLDQDEARKAALMERADMTSSTKEDDDLGWGDEEDDSWDTVPDAKTCKEQTDKQRDDDNAETSVTSSGATKPEEPVVIAFMERLTVEDDEQKGDENEPEQPSGRLTPEEYILSTECDGKLCISNEESIVGNEKTLDCTANNEPHREIKQTIDNKLDNELESNDVEIDNGKTSPVSSDPKDSSSLGDDWDDFDDIEVTEEDVKAAASMTADDDLDDWENWE